MVEKLIKDVVSYMQFLRKEHNLSITIHDTTGFLSKYMFDFVPYNIHCNPYCMYLKSNGDIWNECIKRQHKVADKCKEGTFYGMCYCGVEEFVVPISNDEVLGFICVSGYGSDIEKAQRKLSVISEKYNMDINSLYDMYKKHLSPKPPKMKFIESTINILSNMLSVIYKTEMEIHGVINGVKTNDAYIYGHILTYIRQNFTSKITLDDICNDCHCSKSYISHTFKKKAGCNINNYINNLRVKEAKALLKETELPILEIAFRVGFSDANYFSTAFKSINGVSPASYRNRKK